jgi:hypothetical protein
MTKSMLPAQNLAQFFPACLELGHRLIASLKLGIKNLGIEKIGIRKKCLRMPRFGRQASGIPRLGTPGFGMPGFGTPGFGTSGFGTQGGRVMNRDLNRILQGRNGERSKRQGWMRVTSSFAMVGIVTLSAAATLAVKSASANELLAPALAPAQMQLSATPATAKLPAEMENILRQDLSKQTGLPSKKLRMADASEQTWPDGCLGLGKADELCSQALIQGWRVVLTNGTRRWVYRTDNVGRVYRLEPPIAQPQNPQLQKPSAPIRKSETSTLPVTAIAVGELPPRLARNVVFRAIASGGFTGRTSQTTLLSDGRVIRAWVSADGTLSNPETHQVSLDKVRQFQQSLQAHSFQRFNRQNYPASPGSADFITVTLSSHRGTVRYADMLQAQLPSDLQSVIASWNEVAAK